MCLAFIYIKIYLLLHIIQKIIDNTLYKRGLGIYMINKQIGTKLSALALALLLAGCGGGGSDGYYNTSSSSNNGSTNNGSTNNNESPSPEDSEDILINEEYSLEIDSNKSKLSENGDEVLITVRLIDKNGGGVAGKPVTLILDEIAREKGLTNKGIATKTTDDYGYVAYEVSLKQVTNAIVKNDLLKNGVNISATYVDSMNSQLIHSLHLDIVNVNEVEQAPLYNLRLISNKTNLNVKGDIATIVTQVVNAKGSVVSGQKVTFKIKDANKNFVILSADSDTSDQLGQAKFDLRIPSNLTKVQRDYLLENGIIVEASITDESGRISTKELHIEVSALEGEKVTPNISFGRTNKLASVNDDLDYQETLSVRVVDNDGNAIENTNFSISMQVIKTLSGHYVLGKAWAGELATDKVNLQSKIDNTSSAIQTLDGRKLTLENIKSSNPAEFTPDLQVELNKIPGQIESKTVELNEGKEKKALLDVYEIPKRIQYTCDPEISINDIATKLSGSQITKLGNSYIASTDTEGQFKFQLSYFKSYASWQKIRINVVPKNADINYSMSYDYSLGLLKSDFESEDRQPFDNSPYNIDSEKSGCDTPKPWSHIL